MRNRRRMRLFVVPLVIWSGQALSLRFSPLGSLTSFMPGQKAGLNPATALLNSANGMLDSPEALHEKQAYAAAEHQQRVEKDFVGLEDDLVRLQEQVSNIDMATAEQRADLKMQFKEHQARVAEAIAKVAKLLRAAWDGHYPNHRKEPIILIPESAEDRDIEEAERMEAQSLRDFHAGLLSQCTMMAEEDDEMKRSVERSTDVFEEQAAILEKLPLEDRKRYDEDKIAHWKGKSEQAELAIKSARDELELQNGGEAGGGLGAMMPGPLGG